MSWLWSLFGLRQAWYAPAESLPVTGHPQDSATHELGADAEGWLVGSNVRVMPSVRSSSLSTPQGPIAVVWHFTATDIGTAKSLATRIRTFKRGVDRAASWHVCIDDEGVLWQSVSFLRGAWHCGKGLINGHRVNACSIGIELEGHGRTFSQAQVKSAAALVKVLRETYPISRERAAFGHSQFDPTRRSDPGEKWTKELLPHVLDLAFAKD